MKSIFIFILQHYISADYVSNADCHLFFFFFLRTSNVDLYGYTLRRNTRLPFVREGNLTRFMSSRPQASLRLLRSNSDNLTGGRLAIRCPLAGLGAPTTECVMPHNRSALHTDVGLVCERIPLLPARARARARAVIHPRERARERGREGERAAAIRAACISRGE